MTYQETLKHIDYTVKMYSNGLYSFSDALHMIEKAVKEYSFGHPLLSTNDRISKENRLYRHGLQLMIIESRRIDKG